MAAPAASLGKRRTAEPAVEEVENVADAAPSRRGRPRGGAASAAVGRHSHTHTHPLAPLDTDLPVFPGPAAADSSASASASTSVQAVVGVDVGTAFTGYALYAGSNSEGMDFSLDRMCGAAYGIRTNDLSGAVVNATFGDRSKGPSIVAVESMSSYLKRLQNTSERRAVQKVPRMVVFGADAQKHADAIRQVLVKNPDAETDWDIYEDIKRPLHPMSPEREHAPAAEVTRPSIVRGRVRARCCDLYALIIGQCLSRAIEQYNASASGSKKLTPGQIKVVATYPNEWDEEAIRAARDAILRAPVRFHPDSDTGHRSSASKTLAVGQVSDANVIQVSESMAAFLSLLVETELEHRAAASTRSAIRDSAVQALVRDDLLAVVIDAGAGTVDITCPHIKSLAPLEVREVVYSRGRNLGGSTIEDAFIAFFQQHVFRPIGVRDQAWAAHPMASYSLRSQVMKDKNEFDPDADETYIPPHFQIDFSASSVLFRDRASWWKLLSERLLELSGHAMIDAPLSVTFGDSEITYTQIDDAGCFEPHSAQEGIVLVPRRFLRALLDHNASRIAEFAEHTIEHVNTTMREEPGASSASAAAEPRHFHADVVLVAGQGTVGRVHHAVLEKRLRSAHLVQGQLSRALVFPPGYAMHVARGAVLYSLLKSVQLRRKLDKSYGVRLRLDSAEPWKRVGLTKDFAEKYGISYHLPELPASTISIDYIAPFRQAGDHVMPGTPYHLLSGASDVLEFVPKPDGSPEEYRFEIFASSGAFHPLTPGVADPSPHVIARGWSSELARRKGVRVVRESDAIANAVFKITRRTLGRLRFSFGDGLKGAISAEIEEVQRREGIDTTAGIAPVADLSAIRFVPARVEYRSAARRTPQRDDVARGPAAGEIDVDPVDPE